MLRRCKISPILISLVLFISVGSKADSTSVSRKLILMTTEVEFTIENRDTELANSAIDSAIEEFHRVEARFSEWRNDSEISRANRQAADSPFELSPEAFQLLSAAQSISHQSQGAFDISFSPLGKIWDFRAKSIPNDSIIQDSLKKVGYQKILLDSTDSTLFFATPGMQIGLGAIAKGYAVDRAAQIFRRKGIEQFSINAGGDLYVAGRIWEVGLQDPRNSQQLVALIPVQNAAIATSGDYERFFEINGERYGHIIDPRTGWPAKDAISVSVLAPLAWQADALATAVFVLGPEKGLQLIEAQENIEAAVLDRSGAFHFSTGLKEISQK